MKDYLTKIKGNEAILERFLEAIWQGKCKAVKDYPHPYQLTVMTETQVKVV
jgi:hypothetical protein